MFTNNIFVDFNDVKGLDLTTARANISFPTEVEKVQSATSNKILNKSILFNVTNGDHIPIGFVSDKRKIVPYGELMDLVTNELSNIMPFKLIESNIADRYSSVSQRYLFDYYIENPDGQKLAPMLIVNYSYIGLPLSLKLGTFRYVCSNGAMVKVHDFDKISVNMHDLNSLYIQNLGNIIRRGLDNIDKISDVYAKLASEDWNSYVLKFFNDPDVTVSFKKALVDFLTLNRNLFVTTKDTVKNDTFTTLTLKGDSFIDANGNEIYSIVSNRSAWDFYNDCTDVSSHSSSSISMRKRNDISVSNIFAA